MGKKLVIVESPAKAKTINKILGKDYIVKASMGHVRDLPVHNLGVDIDTEFTPKYVMVKGRKKIVDELKKAAKECDAVYLAPDPDREGEAIAWHLSHILKDKKRELPFYRITYNEITPRAVKEAFEHPSEIDQERVDAQQARRILDRIVGYKVSPLLWSKIQRGLSAGRVQSVALRLICEREDQIRSFEPVTYWVMGAKARKVIVPMTDFEVKLARINGEKADILSADLAKNISKDLELRKLKVAKITKRTVTRKAPPPYITSTLQQAGSRFFGFSPARTMRIAQSLYEGITLGDGPTGLITYMRTDSVSLANDAVESCRAFVVDKHGKKYIPEKPNFYKSRSGAQGAHEAIRPTDVTRTPESLKSRLEKDEFRLYQLIWQRFVACQMSSAKVDQKTIEVEAILDEENKAKSPLADNTYLFRATASEVAFDGYMKVSGTEMKKKAKEGEDDDVASLPPLEEGEPLHCIEWLSEEKETQPPARFSEASLVRSLEENGVGRPSTYAQILSTLNARKYVTREKRTLTPTELGMKVNTLLVAELGKLFDVGFTAGLEETLDDIEHGKVVWTDMLKDFYGKFAEWLETAKGPPADIEQIKGLLELLVQVKEWQEPRKQGRRTYDDNKFVVSIQKQVDDAKKPFSDRQLEALTRMACKYSTQIEGLKPRLEEYGLIDIYNEIENDNPLDTTVKKLDLFKSITFGEPVERGGRTYDDGAFVDSLRSRAESGRSLTDNQRRALDRLVMKYAEQVPNLESRREELGLPDPSESNDQLSGPLLELLGNVKEWNEPVKRGKKEFNDKDFFDSLTEQLKQKGALSDRQQGALKRLVRRYREQIPNYETAEEKYDLKPKKKGSAKKEAEKES